MSELGDVLEVIHTSISRWRTLDASGFEWRNHGRLERAWDRGSRNLGARSVAFARAKSEGPEPVEGKNTWRICLAKPDRVRVEFSVGPEMVSAVFHGDTWWSWSPSRGVTTNEGERNFGHGLGPGEALIDAGSIMRATKLEVVGQGTVLHRACYQVRATPSRFDRDEERQDLSHATLGLGNGADEYLLSVDKERGVLLRSDARIDGEPFRVLEMTDVSFDLDVPEETFAPPDDRPIERQEEPYAFSLSHIPAEVAFVVLVPEDPPFPLQDAWFLPAGGRFRQRIQITYRLHDGEDRGFVLVESGEPMDEDPDLDWRDEGGFRLGEAAGDAINRSAHLEQEGTYVEILSFSLSADELLALARTLVPRHSVPFGGT